MFSQCLGILRSIKRTHKTSHHVDQMAVIHHHALIVRTQGQPVPCSYFFHLLPRHRLLGLSSALTYSRVSTTSCFCFLTPASPRFSLNYFPKSTTPLLMNFRDPKTLHSIFCAPWCQMESRLPQKTLTNLFFFPTNLHILSLISQSRETASQHLCTPLSLSTHTLLGLLKKLHALSRFMPITHMTSIPLRSKEQPISCFFFINFFIFLSCFLKWCLILSCR